MMRTLGKYRTKAALVKAIGRGGVALHYTGTLGGCRWVIRPSEYDTVDWVTSGNAKWKVACIIRRGIVVRALSDRRGVVVIGQDPTSEK